MPYFHVEHYPQDLEEDGSGIQAIHLVIKAEDEADAYDIVSPIFDRLYPDLGHCPLSLRGCDPEEEKQLQEYLKESNKELAQWTRETGHHNS